MKTITQNGEHIFLSSNYTSTIIRGLANKMNGIGQDLLKSINIINNPDTLVEESKNVFGIIGNLDNIPPFTHPIAVSPIFSHGSENNTLVFIDARAYVNNQKEIIRDYNYTFLLKRAQLDQLWEDDFEVFFPALGLTTDIFSSWVSYQLSLKYNMDLIQGVYIRVILAIYFMGLVSNEIISNQEIEGKVAKFLNKNLRIPTETIVEVLELFKGIPSTDNLNTTALTQLYNANTVNPLNYDKDYKGKLVTLVYIINQITNNDYQITLTSFIQTVIRGSFICNNPSEIVGISLEHPPLFYLLIFTILSSNIQNKTSLGKTVLSLKSGNKHDFKLLNHVINTAIHQPDA